MACYLNYSVKSHFGTEFLPLDIETRRCCPALTTTYLFGMSVTGKSIAQPNERPQTASIAEFMALLSGFGEASGADCNGQMDLLEAERRPLDLIGQASAW